jgi:hypothetical protein
MVRGEAGKNLRDGYVIRCPGNVNPSHGDIVKWLCGLRNVHSNPSDTLLPIGAKLGMVKVNMRIKLSQCTSKQF